MGKRRDGIRLKPKILIGILVKNAEQYLINLLSQILNLDYDKSSLSVAFIESDSEDNSYIILKNHIVPTLKKNGFREVNLEKIDYRFPSKPTSRHLPEVQAQRLRNLMLCRQYVVDNYLKDNDYLFWLDADIKYVPPQTLQKLLSFNVDIVCPPLYLEDGTLYDFGTRIDGRTLRQVNCDCELMEVTMVNAIALIHRRVFEAGVNYIGPLGRQEGATFSIKARAKGFKLYSAPKCKLIHVTLSGTMRERPISSS